MPIETYFASANGGAGEDRVDILHFDSGVVLVVADGVGGRPGGGEAATLLVQNVLNYFINADYVVSDLAIAQLLTEIDAALASDEQAGETTAVVAVVTEEEIVGAAVGDSEACLIFPDREYKLTHGRRKPYLGYGAAWPEPLNAAELGNGTLLVATDGLWKYTDLETILAIVRTPGVSVKEIGDRLIAAVRLPNGALRDDVAVAVCRR